MPQKKDARTVLYARSYVWSADPNSNNKLENNYAGHHTRVNI